MSFSLPAGTGRAASAAGRRAGVLHGGRPRLAALFLAPAVLLLATFLLYPTAYSVVRSLFDARGERFVGLGNYATAFTDGPTLTALRNNVIWVLVAPALVTGIGLVLAVLSERVRWAAALRLVLFMPLAISLVASGIVFRLVYDEDPQLGVANAVAVAVHDTVAPPSPYAGARPRDTSGLAADGFAFVTTTPVGPDSAVALPMIGFRPAALPATARQAAAPPGRGSGLRGLVWLDVGASRGRPGLIDPSERGLPGVAIEVLDARGGVVATATTGDDGRFTVPDLAPGSYRVRLGAAGFVPPYRGVTWLGPVLVTPAIIAAWLWIMSGFAMTFIAAGLAAIPRDALEAARVDGATEWQVFRRVTVPLLAPVLLVVLVTLVINVLKVFDLVFVLAPGSVQEEANVLALQIWQVSFGAGGDQGLGSALSVLLFLLVVPAMVFNIRRFKREGT
jgi:alpha-glucoside transport system permease protein